MTFKVDVARAFCNLRVDPADALKFGIAFNNEYFLDAAVEFGWVHRSAVYLRASDAIADVMRQQGYNFICYIDDYICIMERDKADLAYSFLLELLSKLGLPVNKKKLVPPSKVLTCLDIDIDLNNNTLSIEENKLQNILHYG